MVRQAVYHVCFKQLWTFVSRVPLVREWCMLVFRYCAHYCKMTGYRDDHFCISSLLTFYANHFLSQSPLWALSSFGVGCVRGFPSLRRAGALANIAAFLYAFVWTLSASNYQLLLVYVFFFFSRFLFYVLQNNSTLSCIFKHAYYG